MRYACRKSTETGCQGNPGTGKSGDAILIFRRGNRQPSSPGRKGSRGLRQAVFFGRDWLIRPAAA